MKATKQTSDRARWITQRGFAWPLLVHLIIVAALTSCRDDEPSGPESEGTTLQAGLLISEPVGPTGSSSLAAGAIGLVYMSASPGALPGSTSLTVTNLATGESIATPIVEGGFDPIAISGSPGDELEIVVRTVAGTTSVFRVKVPKRKRPRVVRTRPTKDATDVVLNSSVAVVFSEPVDPRTVTPETIELVGGGARVSGRLTLSFDGLRAEFTPDQPLAPQTTYTIRITTGVADLTGDPLEELVEVIFTTGSSLANQAIAFTSNRTGRFEIYVTNDDGSAQVNLTNSPGTSPTWSPDGSKMAFVSGSDGNFEIYAMPTDRSGIINLTKHGAPDMDPEWSPDGGKIAFHTARDRNWEIYLMNSDGSDPLNLTRSNQTHDIQPTWSPDGSQLVFASNRGEPDRYDLYVMDADGANPRLLVEDAALPAWSPEGSKIAFVSGRDGNADIYVIDSGGTNVVNLTRNPGPDIFPAWSPDGSRIVFASWRGEQFGGDPPYEIYVMSADGSEVVRLTTNTAMDTHPAWRLTKE